MIILARRLNGKGIEEVVVGLAQTPRDLEHLREASAKWPEGVEPRSSVPNIWRKG